MERIADYTVFACTLLTLLLAALRVAGAISISWFWITFPVMCIPIAIALVVAVVLIAQALMDDYSEEC